MFVPEVQAKLDKQAERFNNRTMKRREYEAITRMYRRAESRSRRTYRSWYGRMSEPLTSHVFDIERWHVHVRWCEKRNRPEFLYYPISEGYWDYWTDCQTDIGACEYEAKLERAASYYHLYDDGGGLIIEW